MEDMENLLFVEDMFEEYGKLDGYNQGLKNGELQGRMLGIEKGFEIAKEIGFYIGFAEYWIELLQNQEFASKYPPRLLAQLHTFLQLGQTFQIDNDANLDPVQLLGNLKGKYKAIQSLTKTNVSYGPATQKLNY